MGVQKVTNSLSHKKPSSMALAVVISIVGAVLGGVAGAMYPPMMDWFVHTFLWQPFGPFVILKTDDEKSPAGLTRGHVQLKNYRDYIWGDRWFRKENRHYTYSGYLKNGHIILAYRTAESDGNGYGAYFLMDVSNDGTEYVGHAQVNTCTPEGQVVKDCNMVLVKGYAGSKAEEDALAKYKELLGQECAQVKFFDERTNPEISVPPRLCPKALELLLPLSAGDTVRN